MKEENKTDAKQYESEFWKQNRKNKQYPLAPKRESDTESYGEPQ